MGEETAQAVAALIPSLVQPAGAKHIFVKFYGGEPLLNFPALERITLELRRQEAGLGKNFHFLLDTNGLLLEGRAAQFLARHFAEVAVSVDGRQGVHDLQRRDLIGGGTWERIAGNLRYFPRPGILRLRATLTSSSDSFIDTFRQLCSLGIRRIQLEYCHLSGYRGEDRAYRRLTVPPKRQLAELREFLEHYIATIASIRDPRRVPFLSSVLEDIAGMNRGHRATRPCSAGTQTLAIDCRGEIFPCIAFADCHRFSVGNVRGKAAPPVGLQSPLPAEEVEERVTCRSCWVRYHCAGGCYATHYSMTGDLMRPDPQYCLLMRGKAEIYLQALAQILRRCPWHLAPFSREPPDGGYPWRGMT